MALSGHNVVSASAGCETQTTTLSFSKHSVANDTSLTSVVLTWYSLTTLNTMEENHGWKLHGYSGLAVYKLAASALLAAELGLKHALYCELPFRGPRMKSTRVPLCSNAAMGFFVRL